MINMLSKRRTYNLDKENDIKPDIYNIDEIKKFTSVQKAKVLGIAKSTFYEKKKNKFIVKEKKIKYEEIIIKNFFNNNEGCKRRLAYYIFKMHNIKINPRTLGNYMKNFI